MTILSFKSKALKQYWGKGNVKGIKPEWLNRVRLILSTMDAAITPEELDLPGLNFHLLKGDKTGLYSVLVSRNWRITFSWQGKDAAGIDLEDYHGD